MRIFFFLFTARILFLANSYDLEEEEELPAFGHVAPEEKCRGRNAYYHLPPDLLTCDDKPIDISCCDPQGIAELQMWINYAEGYEQQLQEKGFPTITAKGHDCEEAINHSFHKIKETGKFFKQMAEYGLQAFRLLADELICERCWNINRHIMPHVLR